MEEMLQMETIFELMDENGDGTLSWSEFAASFEDESIMERWTLLDYKKDECQEIFQLLDTGDGHVERNEFFTGLRHCKGQASSKELFKVLAMLRAIDKTSRQIFSCMSPTEA